MPKTKKSQIPKETIFQRLAGLMRLLSAMMIVIFIICYIEGASRQFGTSILGYVKAAAVTAALLTVIAAIREIIRMRKEKTGIGRLMVKLPMLFVAFYIAGYMEYYVMLHRKLYWIVLAILIVAVTLSVYEFWIQLKTMWRGNVHSREKTLVQFIYLYTTTIFSFTFLYTILYKPGFEFFEITYPSDPFFDFLYLSIITVSTLGYGDIIPQTALAKFLVMLQTIIGYLFLYIFLGLVVSWLGTREK